MTALNDWRSEEILQAELTYRPRIRHVNFFFNIWQYKVDAQEVDTQEVDTQEVDTQEVDTPKRTNPGWNMLIRKQELEIPQIEVKQSLERESLDEWLNLVPPSVEGRTLVGGLRLIYSHVQPIDCNEMIYVIPFGKSDLDKILRVFELPLLSASILSGLHTSFRSFSPEDPGGSHGRCTYVWSTPNVRPYWSTTASYDPKKNVTYAYLRHYSTKPDEQNAPERIVIRPKRIQLSSERILSHLQKIASSLMHPLIIPVLAADIDADSIVGGHYRLDTRMRKIEVTFTNNDMSQGVPIILDSLQCDLPRFVSELRDCSVHLAHMWEKVENYALTLPLMKKETKKIRDYIEQILESMEIQNQSITPKHHRIQSNLQMLLSVFKTDNLYVQRDNKLSQLIANASKRDSSAMKVLAVVTMVFLPGTFVASFFTIPLFNWDATDGEKVVNNRFYIYWAVTIPLTIVVLAAWGIWVRVILNTYNKEDAKIGISNYEHAHHDSSPHTNDEGDRGGIWSIVRKLKFQKYLGKMKRAVFSSEKGKARRM